MASLDMAQLCLEEMKNSGKINTYNLLDAMQNLIGSAGALSRYFWPSSKKTIHCKRAEALKLAFSIQDDNPLKERKVRNFVEHFDENLDEFLSNYPTGIIIPSFVGLKPKETNVIPLFFRAYYVDTWSFCVMHFEYDIRPIGHELIRISDLLTEYNKTGRLPNMMSKL